jgi:hypothetical protein
LVKEALMEYIVKGRKIDLDQKVLDKVTYFIQKAEENRKIIET